MSVKPVKRRRMRAVDRLDRARRTSTILRDRRRDERLSHRGTEWSE